MKRISSNLIHDTGNDFQWNPLWGLVLISVITGETSTMHNVTTPTWYNLFIFFQKDLTTLFGLVI